VVSASNRRTPPHDLDMEKGVLSSMLQPHGGTKAIEKAVTQLNAEFFFVPAHRTIFTVIADLFDAHNGIDLITVTSALRERKLLKSVGDVAYVAQLATFVPTAANVAHYIEGVREKYQQRQIIVAATEAVRRAYEPDSNDAVLDELESRITSIRSLHGRNSGLPEIDDAAVEIAKPIVTPDDVIAGLLHRGEKMQLGGSSKAFKTWLMFDVAACVTTGTDWLGKFPTKRGRVLYLNFELPRAWCFKRIKAICDENQIKLEKGYLQVWNLRGYACDMSTLLPRLLRRIKPGAFVLIIIDPIYKIYGEHRDENRAGDMASLHNQLELLAVKTGAAVLYGAHFSKGNQAAKDPLDRVGGSGVFGRDPDTALTFTKHEEEDCFTVTATFRTHPPIPEFVVRWQYPLMTVDSLLDPTRLKLHGSALKRYSVSDVMEHLTETMTTAKLKKTVLEETGMSDSTFYRLFREAKHADLAVKAGKNRWRPNE
jgi:hypothetical protein